jgi:hypothetical protein
VTTVARPVVDLATHPTVLEITAPARIAVGWYVRAWQQRLRPPPAGVLPRTPPSVLLALNIAFDETVLSVARLSRRTPHETDIARIEGEAVEALELFRANGWLDEPASYHENPFPLTEVNLRKARSGAIRYTVLSYDSEYEPHDDEPGRDRWLAQRENRTAYAWMLRHDEPRPWLVCIHGAAMGTAVSDLRVFRAAWLHSVLGLNVVLPIQPRHGPRREGLPFGVGFPDQDLMDNVHAVAQSVWDIRRLLGWIRMQQPDARIGVQGLSLGGYTAALLAGLDDDLACVIATVPAVDFANLMERHAPAHFRNDPRLSRLTALALDVQRVISPLAIEPRVPIDRRYIFAGVADRLVHPLHQVQRLWTHWDEPTITWFQGSHLGGFRSRRIRDFVEEALRDAGLLDHIGVTEPTEHDTRAAQSS